MIELPRSLKNVEPFDSAIINNILYELNQGHSICVALKKCRVKSKHYAELKRKYPELKSLIKPFWQTSEIKFPFKQIP